MLPPFNFYINNILISFGLPSIGTVLYMLILLTEFYGMILAQRTRAIGKGVYALSIIVSIMAILSYLIYYDELGTRLINEKYHIYYSELLFLFFFGLPMLLISSACRRWDLVVNYSSKIAPVIVALAFIAWRSFGFSTWGDLSINYMVLSYNLLTAGCICIAQAVKGVRPVYWIATSIFLFIILAAGCRGALVCVIAFVALILFYQATTATRGAKAWRLMGMVILLVIPLTITSLFGDIEGFFYKSGISSRSMEMLSDDTFFEDAARNSIRTAIWRGVTENPLGYGLYGDRYVCAKYYQGGAEYSHNIVYEFIADFGIVLGSVLLIVIIISIVKIYRKQRTTDIGFVLLFLIPDGLLKLLFSNSFLMNPTFFIIIGILFSYRSIKAGVNYTKYQIK